MLQVVDRAHTALPEALTDEALALLDGRGLRLDAGAWEPAAAELLQGLPSETLGVFQAALKRGRPQLADGPILRWHQTLPLRAQRPAGRAWLRHAERDVAHHEADPHGPAASTPAWFDESRHVLFLWDLAAGELLAFGEKPGATVELGFRIAPDSALGVAERERLGDGTPVDAQALTARLRLGAQDRACLVTPSPATLALDVARLDATALRVAVGVLDHGLAGQPAGVAAAAAAAAEEAEESGHSPAGSDGVTFAVDVTTSSGTVRAWERHVRVGEGFHEAHVDLARWSGQALRLSLVTEPGPHGDAALDHAAWADLRLQGPPGRQPSRPHVVIIDIDTLRADRLGCYGYQRPTTPRLDAWAREQATVFTDALAPANWTLPSTISMLSGLTSSQHGASVQGRGFPSGTSIASHLSQAGYETMAHTDGGYVGPGYGFADGFDLFEVRSLKHAEASDWDVVLRRLEARRSERPVFLFLQTYLVHAPYAVDRRFAAGYDGPLAALEELPGTFARDVRAGRLQLDADDRAYVDALYDAGVRRMDDLVGDLLERLEQLFEGQDHVVVFTSDHGEELFERDLVGHAHSLHREVLAVPLVVRFPGGARVGVDARPVSGLDVVPTLLDAVGLPVPALLAGRSLLQPLPPQRLRVSAQSGTHAVQLDGWKLMAGELGTPQRPAHLPWLVELAADPDERDDRWAAAPGRGAQLSGLYEEHVRQYAELPPDDADLDALDAGTLADLRALGYLGDG